MNAKNKNYIQNYDLRDGFKFIVLIFHPLFDNFIELAPKHHNHDKI